MQAVLKWCVLADQNNLALSLFRGGDQSLLLTREDLPELIEAIDQAFGVDLVDNNLRDYKD